MTMEPSTASPTEVLRRADLPAIIVQDGVCAEVHSADESTAVLEVGDALTRLAEKPHLVSHRTFLVNRQAAV